MSFPSQADSESSSLTLDQVIEKVCRPFEAALKAASSQAQTPRVEDFLSAAQGGERSLVLRELVLLEVHYRCRQGETLDAAEYRACFPELDEAWLTDVLATGTTQMGAAGGAACEAPHSLIGPYKLPGDAAEQGHFSPHGDRMVPTSWREGLPVTLPACLGRYTLQTILGKGGMGAVYRAHDTHLDRTVALKIPTFGANPGTDQMERFLREARAAAMISHPNLCPVYDAGEIGGIHFLAMAYIEGKLLSEIVPHGPIQPVRESVRLIRQMALAMGEAHRRGVIHRDLKPANVMIDSRGQPIIMDFGLARRGLETRDVRLTQSGMILGTPAYMPPEQVNGAVAAMGPGCDIYSLGVILYELLAGRLPFTGNLGQLMVQITSASPPPMAQFRPAVDPELEAICVKALAKNSAARFRSMPEFAEALEWHAQDPGERSVTPGDSIIKGLPASGTREKQPGRHPRAASDVGRHFLAARYYLEKRTEEGLRKSIATYQQILDYDPTVALAWTGLAFAYHMLTVWGHASPTNACPKAKSAALRALELDGGLGEAQTTLAAILMEYDWDLVEAERIFRLALELNPNYAFAHQLYGKCLACLGRHVEAIAEFRRAQDLDPLSPTIGVVLGRHGYLLARMYQQAVEQFRKTIETDPSFWLAHRFLGWAYLFQGNIAEAINELTTAKQLEENSATLVGLGYAYAVSSQPEKAEAALQALKELAQHGYVAPDCQAIIYIGLGDKDLAFSWLAKVVEDRSEWLCKIRVDPVFDPLRSDPRFADLLQRVNGGQADIPRTQQP